MAAEFQSPPLFSHGRERRKEERKGEEDEEKEEGKEGGSHQDKWLIFLLETAS